MRARDNQGFLSLYFEKGAVEIATGELSTLPRDATWKNDARSSGQVETPWPIAELLARWAMSLSPQTVLDPAAGLGTLLLACRDYHSSAQLIGVERDSDILKRARSLAPQGTKLILADYLLSDAGQFDAIVANPPYVKAHRLTYTDSNWRYFEERFGTSLDRLTNLYGLFLLKIWEDLSPGGRAAVIIPAEFLNANFGEEIKERLLRNIRPRGIVVFAPNVNLFASSLTTSAILFLEKNGDRLNQICAKKVDSIEEADSFVTYLLGKEIDKSRVTYTDLGNFQPREKWLNTLLRTQPFIEVPILEKRVGDYFKCRRGIATGANDYFTFSPSDLARADLHQQHVEPCITKASDATTLIFDEDNLAELVAKDRRCYLLNPRTEDAPLRKYLLGGDKLGIAGRHLPKHRPPWYKPENRPVASIWVPVFSRGNVRFILNTSLAKNLTCFHGLYPIEGNENLSPLLALFLNSSFGQESFRRANRFYGDGLNKVEPKDVESFACPSLPDLDRDDATRVTEQLRAASFLEAEACRKMIDDLVIGYFNLAPTNFGN